LPGQLLKASERKFRGLFVYGVSFLLVPKERTKEKAPHETAPSGSTAVLGKILKQANSLRSDIACFLTDFSSAPRLFQRGLKARTEL
jgi:hypothetical protein